MKVKSNPRFRDDVLVISSGLIHPSFRSRSNFAKLLQTLDKHRFHFSTSVEDLYLLGGDNYSAAILYLQQANISPEALKTLEVFLLKGGGLFLLHGSSTSFLQPPYNLEILGGRYISHGETTNLTIKPGPGCHEFRYDLAAFTVTDALCFHELAGDLTIHFYASLDHQEIPVVWSKNYYLGRVVYCSLGHCPAVFKSPEVGQIISQTIDWISEQKTKAQFPELDETEFSGDSSAEKKERRLF